MTLHTENLQTKKKNESTKIDDSITKTRHQVNDRWARWLNFPYFKWRVNPCWKKSGTLNTKKRTARLGKSSRTETTTRLCTDRDSAARSFGQYVEIKDILS